MALGFLILPLGIKLAGADGKSAFVWLFPSYVLQSIGELLISPIGYAMIGKLAPRQYQGVMMGSWMLVTGLASLFAGDFSGMIPEPTGTTAVATNPGYAKLFAELGAGSLAVGVALVVLIPFLRKLITDKAEMTPAEMPYGYGGAGRLEWSEWDERHGRYIVTRVGASERGQRTSFKTPCYLSGRKIARSQRRGCGPSVSVPAALTVLPLERTAASIFFSVVIKGS